MVAPVMMVMMVMMAPVVMVEMMPMVMVKEMMVMSVPVVMMSAVMMMVMLHGLRHASFGINGLCGQLHRLRFKGRDGERERTPNRRCNDISFHKSSLASRCSAERAVRHGVSVWELE